MTADDLIPNDDYSAERPWRDMPLTIRRRLDWSHGDAAQIGYTSRQMDLGLAAIECWWEQVLGLNWFDLRQRNMGSPSVDARVEFYQPLEPGERTNIAVFVERIGRSSWNFRADGFNDSGIKCFSTWQTAVLVDRVGIEKPTSTPIPDDWRLRAEGYRRECDLAGEGVASRREVLDFWFAPPGHPERGQFRQIWFGGDDAVEDAAFDAEIKNKFAATAAAAARGDLDHWMATAAGSLALVILLDQFPRNMHRGRAAAFASDNKALAVAKSAIEQGFEIDAVHVVQLFFYMPFQHCEEIDAQLRSFDLFAGIEDNPNHERTMKSVQEHHDIIERFGRYPHRNEALGRETTAEEAEFLKDPKVYFGQR